MNRRHFLITTLGATLATLAAPRLFGSHHTVPAAVTRLVKSDSEWREILSGQQYRVLRQEGTERAFSSPLNHDTRSGTYVCAGCALPLFASMMKFDSGTGWPSFFTSLPGAVETRLDLKMIFPRREYHCARCGGHQGHVFKDGPPPTGQRWCNNGLALAFIPA